MQHKDIETFHSLADLERFGVIPLTGEACGLAMRVLCDLTKEGCDLIREFMRVEPVADAWNNKGVKSIMLPRNIFQDLWLFAHVRAGAKNVFLGGYCMGDDWTETAYESLGEIHRHPVETWTPDAYAVNSDENMQRLLRHEGECFYITRWFKKSTHPGTGIDNQHAMSGRTI